jgi:hypothetical protein
MKKETPELKPSTRCTRNPIPMALSTVGTQSEAEGAIVCNGFTSLGRGFFGAFTNQRIDEPPTYAALQVMIRKSKSSM